MNRSTKIALYATAALLFAGGHAMAGDGWAGGEIFSGSGNNFAVSTEFRDVGAGLGGFAASGWNSGSANAGGTFTGGSFHGYADSWNSGAAAGLGGVTGFGADRANFSMDLTSMGQSFGEVEFRFDR